LKDEERLEKLRNPKVTNMGVKVVESEKLDIKNPVAITGFPDVGLVGTIAVSHLISTLDLKEIGHIESDELPPIIVVHGKRPKAPIRLYGNAEIVVAVSEIPIPHSLVYALSDSLVDWFKAKGVKLAVLLGGMANPRRMEVEKPEVYGVSTGKGQDEILQKKDIKFFEEGFITGQDGVILRNCMEKGLASIYLMAETHYGYPDPGAAAAVIQAANKILGLDVDVKMLLEKEEEIRIVTRDLMRRTEENMKKVQKMQEQEIPVMYR
jgi:uncharacterized protein